MIRKLEKGEPLEVGDRIALADGAQIEVLDANEKAFGTKNNYFMYDSPETKHILATASITRDEPEGKWAWDDGRFRGPDRIHRSRAQVIDILNDQAATIERLKKVIRDYADELQSGTQFSNLALQWQEDFGRMADAMRQEAEK